MRISLTLLFCLLISMVAFAQTEEEAVYFNTDTIPTSEAKKYIGKYYTFCDQITAIYTLNQVDGQPTMITLNKGAAALTLVIWASDAKENFDKPLKDIFKVGDNICVQGQISDYKGSPRLEIGTPKQVKKVE